MSLGKVIGIIVALVFILFNYHLLITSFHEGINQINSIMGSSNSLRISVKSVNLPYLILEVYNPLNMSILVVNVTGDYVYLVNNVIVPPLSNATLTLKITNYYAFAQNVNQNQEILTITLIISNTSITEVTRI